ncbi:general transcription factor IIH subunit 2-like protein [Oppia nitens]|uniref:general transcription factor IIH subunit 2-like protein n=1 Tax=Oppia nitens TaxID=1686743 RepID=UPI0023DB9936|nr:general transcription factor IIH subunit 2-like protein [Oppia nitens]
MVESQALMSIKRQIDELCGKLDHLVATITSIPQALTQPQQLNITLFQLLSHNLSLFKTNVTVDGTEPLFQWSGCETPPDLQLFVHNIRCSVIGLAAELRICRTLAQKTKGLYDVVMDEGHYKELVYQHMDPPASSMTESSLMQMGFPTYMNDSQTQASMCVCHLNNACNFSTTGYLCPKCQSKYCDLPVECQVCGLTLVSPAHLARSYHHHSFQSMYSKS